MAYELNTVYRPTVPNTEDDFRRVWATFKSGGALSATAISAMTGPFVGCLAISSRWDSLDAMAAWWAGMAARMGVGGEFHDVAVNSGPALMRLLMADVAESGRFDGAYVASTRANVTNVRPESFHHAAALIEGAGCNGTRLEVATVGGEWTGQYVVQTFTDSLDALPAASAACMADKQFLSDVKDEGVQLISRTYFSVVSRMT